MIDLDELKKLAEAASPGEWNLKKHGVIVAGPFREYVNGSAQSQIAMFTVTDDSDRDRQEDNAAFVCAANPAVILELIRMVRGKS